MHKYVGGKSYITFRNGLKHHYFGTVLLYGLLSFSFLLDLCRILYASLLLLVVLWFTLDTAKRGIRQIVSFCGLFLFILLMLLFSKHPFRVRQAPTHPPTLSASHTNTHWSLTAGWRLQWSWRALISGTFMQFFIALLIFRTSTGASALELIAHKVEVHP